MSPRLWASSTMRTNKTRANSLRTSPASASLVVIQGSNVGIQVHDNNPADFDHLLTELTNAGLRVTISSTPPVRSWVCCPSHSSQPLPRCLRRRASRHSSGRWPIRPENPFRPFDCAIISQYGIVLRKRPRYQKQFDTMGQKSAELSRLPSPTVARNLERLAWFMDRGRDPGDAAPVRTRRLAGPLARWRRRLTGLVQAALVLVALQALPRAEGRGRSDGRKRLARHCHRRDPHSRRPVRRRVQSEHREPEVAGKVLRSGDARDGLSEPSR